DAAPQKRDQSVARVEVALVVFQVVVREQHLGDAKIEFVEKCFVGGHEPRLADGGTRLKFREVGRSLFKAERAHARADSAGTDQYDFLSGLPLRGDLRDQLFELRMVQLFPAVGEDAGAELDDNAADLMERRALHGASW